MRKYYKMFCIIFLNLCVCTMVHASINDGLIAHYPLDGDASDISGYNHHGETTTNTIYWTEDRFGNPNSAWQRISNVIGHIDTLTDFSWNIDDSYSISLWFNTSDINLDQVLLGKFSFYDTPEYSLRIERQPAYGKLVFQQWQPGCLHGFAVAYRGDLTPNTWYHVVVIYDGTDQIARFAKMFINGELIELTTDIRGSSFQNGDESTTFGSGFWLWRSFRGFVGKLDDIRMYNRALSDLEVSQLYNNENGNAVPIADAGPGQAVIEIGSLVQLDGTQSYDPEGDPITYSWTMVSRPEGSNSLLGSPISPNPSFIADKHGDYVISLVVSDPSSSSEPSTVVISFENIQPVANTGSNQSVVQGQRVCFDGSLSSDPNFDFLTYNWNIVSIPNGSLAFLDDPFSVTPCIDTDLPGTYEVTLTVNDGFVNSEPDFASVVAVTYIDAVAFTLQEAINEINLMPLSHFKNKNMQKTLTHKINETLQILEEGAYTAAQNKLKNDIISKSDGCTTSNFPDKNDWIINCESQNKVYSLLMKTVSYLKAYSSSN